MRGIVRAPTLAGGLAVLIVAATAARAQEPAPPPPRYATTVTAAPAAPTTPREDSSAAASVILPSDSPRAYDDLGTLLLEVPGVVVARTGSTTGFATLALRGSNPDEVLIYVDGVPLNIAEGGGVDISTLPLGDVERVEVYRGTTPLAFGEAALGGVVSITTRTPGATRVQARAAVGSFGTAFGDISGVDGSAACGSISAGTSIRQRATIRSYISGCRHSRPRRAPSGGTTTRSRGTVSCGWLSR